MEDEITAASLTHYYPCPVICPLCKLLYSVLYNLFWKNEGITCEEVGVPTNRGWIGRKDRDI